MALIICSDCKREHSDAAPACPQCGRPNTSASERIYPLEVTPAPVALSVLRLSGALLLLCGAGALVYFYRYFDTSVAIDGISFMGQTFGVGDRVNNLGLMQDRQNGLLLGALGVVVGIALLLFDQSRQPKGD